MSLPIEMAPENDMNSMCRVCGNVATEGLVALFGSHGIEELGDKISKYLPIKICSDDVLPTQICAPCANTVLSWDLLYNRCLSADKKFTILLSEEKLTEEVYAECMLDADGTESVMKEESMGENASFDDTGLESLHCIDLIDSPKQNSESSEDENDNFGDNMFMESDSERESLFNDETTAGTIEESKTYDSGGIMKKRRSNIGSKEFQFLNSINEEGNSICEEKKKRKQRRLLTDTENSKRRTFCKANGKFICPDCDETFTDDVSFCNHLVNKHNDNGSWLALISRTYDEKRMKADLSKLEASKISIKNKKHFKCTMCKYVTRKSSSWLNHYRIHTGEKPYACILCGKDFRIFSAILRHVQSVHLLIKNYSCELCGNKFVSMANLREHTNTHTDNRPFVCDKCGKTFRQKSSLLLHKRIHESTFLYNCNYCNKGFRQRIPWENHVALHTGERPYACGFCEKSFRSRFECQNHQKTHSSEKPYSCEACNSKFKLKRYLTKHTRLCYIKTCWNSQSS